MRLMHAVPGDDHGWAAQGKIDFGSPKLSTETFLLLSKILSLAAD